MPEACIKGTSNWIPQILWDVITCPCAWYLLLAHTSFYECAEYIGRTVACYFRCQPLSVIITLPCGLFAENGINFSITVGLIRLIYARRQVISLLALLALLALCAENSPVPVNSPHKGQWRGALMFSLICTWINAWVNNREAGDLRRHRAHYDVIVMDSHWHRSFEILVIVGIKSNITTFSCICRLIVNMFYYVATHFNGFKCQY